MTVRYDDWKEVFGLLALVLLVVGVGLGLGIAGAIVGF